MTEMKNEIDIWLDSLTPEQLAFIAWISSDEHPANVAYEVEQSIDAELAAQHADWLDEKRTLEDARY